MNPETAPQNNTPNQDVEEPNLDLDLSENTEENTQESEQDQQTPEYSDDDKRGLAQAAEGAAKVLEGAVSGERRMNTSYTSDGLRNVVEALGVAGNDQQ